jgi:hypothetical protein
MADILVLATQPHSPTRNGGQGETGSIVLGERFADVGIELCEEIAEIVGTGKILVDRGEAHEGDVVEAL